MTEVSLPRIGDPSNPDWIEARRLATNLLASRIGGGVAREASYEDALRWVNGQPPEVAIGRLIFLAEALLRLATAAVSYAAHEHDSGGKEKAAEIVSTITSLLDRLEDRGDDDTFTVKL